MPHKTTEEQDEDQDWPEESEFNLELTTRGVKKTPMTEHDRPELRRRCFGVSLHTEFTAQASVSPSSKPNYRKLNRLPLEVLLRRLRYARGAARRQGDEA